MREKLRRTLVEVLEVDNEEGIVTLLVEKWNATQRVFIYADQIKPITLLDQLVEGVGFLQATVNFNAKKPEELKISDFGVAPENHTLQKSSVTFRG